MPGPIINVVVRSNKAKSTLKAIPEIRKEIEEKGCEFSIEALALLGSLLDRAEHAAKLRS